MRQFEEMTKAEVIDAQRAWVNAVIDQDVETLLGLYDFGTPAAPLLFKPTLANEIRLDAGWREALSAADRAVCERVGGALAAAYGYV